MSGLGNVWTRNKAQLVARYIFLFTQITKHGAYIDGFAAPKEPDIPASWAAKAVIETQPRWLRQAFLCDISADGALALRNLVAEQPDQKKRHYAVLEGDFNARVHDVLESGLIKPKTASFCLLDQFSTQCHWATLKALAQHKPGGEKKIELFYFLATGWIARTLAGYTANLDKPDLWWGGDGWKQYVSRDGSQRLKTDQFTLKFGERIRDELGYRFVKAYPIYEKEKGGGKTMFYMIHASDHPDANSLMIRAHKEVTEHVEPGEQLKLELPPDSS